MINKCEEKEKKREEEKKRMNPMTPKEDIYIKNFIGHHQCPIPHHFMAMGLFQIILFGMSHNHFQQEI